MNKVKQLLTLSGSALIIASCQLINNESDIASKLAAEPAVLDTVPKRSDTIPTRPSDTTGKPDTTTMHRTDTTSFHYVDLSTGQPVDLYYDPKARRTYSSVTNQPVDFYVDMATGDTIYGRGRYVVNNYIVRSNDGMYRLDAAKVKIDKDDVKIKDGSKKFKMDKSEMKMKGAGEKMKMDTTSGKMKMKTNDMKKKVDNEKSKTKY
jgi:hypothetical protein